MKLFEEEQEVLSKLLDEWYAEINEATKQADGIFSAKAKLYDKSSPVWERIAWPLGFMQELRKKTDRLVQLYESDKPFNEVVRDVNEELIDIMNYARMCAALNVMVARRDGAGSMEASMAFLAGAAPFTRKSGAQRASEMLNREERVRKILANGTNLQEDEP